MKLDLHRYDRTEVGNIRGPMKLDIHRPSLFPVQWSELVLAITKTGKPVRVEALSKSGAYRLRLRFYTFRRSLHHDPMKQELALQADTIMALIDGCNITFMSRDTNEEALMLQAAIKEME